MKETEKIRVLGISASPRAAQENIKSDINHGTSLSDAMLVDLLNYIETFGGEAQIIRLAEKKIAPCAGCYSQEEKACVFPCIHEDDDTNQILEEIMKADALAFATPIYWGSVSSLLRILIEKMTVLENDRWNIYDRTGRDPVEGKPYVLLATQISEGASLALSQMVWSLNNMGLIFLPYGFIYKQSILNRKIVRLGLRLIGERKFEWAENTLRLAARNLVLFTAAIKDYSFDDDTEREPIC
jgi:multimeric flavodoxin WrbA